MTAGKDTNLIKSWMLFQGIMQLHPHIIFYICMNTNSHQLSGPSIFISFGLIYFQESSSI